jgi:hypothetical protein
MQNGIIFGITLPTVEKFSLCTRKSSKLKIVCNSDPHAEANFNN